MTRPLLASFIDFAVEQPDAPALVWHREAVSYGRLLAMADATYERIRRAGLPAGRPVGLLAGKSPDAIALILACLMDGRPFLLPSAELGEETLWTLFGRSGCSHVLSPVPESGQRTADLAIHPVKGPLSDATPPHGTAFMLTTSGSTGLPKVVPLSAAAVDAFIAWAAGAFGIGPGSTVLNYAPLNFDLCFLDIWTTLAHGGCAVLVDQSQSTNAAHLLDLVGNSEVAVIQAVPMFYRLLLDARQNDARRFDHVKHVIFTGDSLSPACLSALPGMFPNAHFYNVYGCTETNDSFIHKADPGAVPPAGSIPIGWPLPGVSALILTEEGTELEGPGIGELIVSTPFQTAGYLEGALNEGRFSSRLHGGKPRIYFHSGDLVCRHGDGSVTLKGRRDFHVKVRGTRVNTQEIEQVILEHEEVADAAVIAIPDPMAGNRLHALVQRKRTGTLNSLLLRQHCAGRLTRVAIPSTIEIMEAALPKTSTGKVNRKQILNTLLNGV